MELKVILRNSFFGQKNILLSVSVVLALFSGCLLKKPTAFQSTDSLPKEAKTVSQSEMKSLHECALEILKAPSGFPLDSGGLKVSTYLSVFADGKSVFMYGLNETDTNIYFFDGSGLHLLLLGDQKELTFLPSVDEKGMLMRDKFDIVLPVQFVISGQKAAVILKLKYQASWLDRMKSRFVSSYETAGRYKRSLGGSRDLWPQDVWNNVTSISGTPIHYGLIKTKAADASISGLFKMLNSGLEEELRLARFRFTQNLPEVWRPWYDSVLQSCGPLFQHSFQKWQALKAETALRQNSSATVGDTHLEASCGKETLKVVYLRCKAMEVRISRINVEKCLNVQISQSATFDKVKVNNILKSVHPDLNPSFLACATKTTQWVNQASNFWSELQE
jgi:hypothetical protein